MGLITVEFLYKLCMEHTVWMQKLVLCKHVVVASIYWYCWCTHSGLSSTSCLSPFNLLSLPFSLLSARLPYSFLFSLLSSFSASSPPPPKPSAFQPSNDVSLPTWPPSPHIPGEWPEPVPAVTLSVRLQYREISNITRTCSSEWSHVNMTCSHIASRLLPMY